MYRFTLTLVRDNTERTGPGIRRRQVRKITLKALVSAQAWNWESAFELTDPTSIERGWRLPARVIYTFVGGSDPGPARIKQDRDIILREMKRIGEFDTWKGKNWYYSNVKLERVGEQLVQPTLEEFSPAIKDAVVSDLSGFEYHYEVMASPRVAH
jgi:hypothetical protein